MWQIVLTASFTLLGGVVLFVFGEFIRTLVIVPLQTYKAHVETVLDRLDFYANFYTRFFNDEPSAKEKAQIESYVSHMRSAASQLTAKYTLIGWKRFLIWRKTIPTREQVQSAHKSLTYLSNSILYEGLVHDTNNSLTNSKEADKVREALVLS